MTTFKKFDEARFTGKTHNKGFWNQDCNMQVEILGEVEGHPGHRLHVGLLAGQHPASHREVLLEVSNLDDGFAHRSTSSGWWQATRWSGLISRSCGSSA